MKEDKIRTEYRKSGKIHSCILTKSDLLQLVDIVIKGFPEFNQPGPNENGHYVEFSINTYFTHSSVETDTVEEFLQIPNLPKEIDNFFLSASEFIPGAHVKFVTVSLGSSILSENDYYQVLGLDDIWVRGKFEQLTEYFMDKRAWHWFFREKTFASINWFDIVYVSIVMVFLGFALLIGSSNLLFVATITLLIIMWTISLLAFHREAIFKSARIDLTEEKVKLVTRENVVALFTIIGTIAAILQLLM